MSEVSWRVRNAISMLYSVYHIMFEITLLKLGLTKFNKNNNGKVGGAR